MSDYQVIARKFRPKVFKDVLGQEAIITTLQNAIKFNKLAHAYLFCGSRGTGKTTLARLLAKAINCEALTVETEPCNQCRSCKSISSGSSLDVLEIDGASNRGIDDVRKINETVAYAPTGRYKIYIIDEVHMLTKDAFNALLKTLEEPPSHVKFFFATTEAHKVLPTIVSRCQRFQLRRIPVIKIEEKLASIAREMNVRAEPEALQLIAERAEGGLRDAESLMDQVLAFQEGDLTKDSVEGILGLVSRDLYFEIDQAGKAGRFIKAFEIVDQIFSEGKDFSHFIEGLIQHFRQLLLFKLSNHQATTPSASKYGEKLQASALLYTQEQCLDLIDYLLESQEKLRFSSFGKLSLEAILLHVMRSHFQLPLELLVHRLSELEESLNSNASIKRIEPSLPPEKSRLPPTPPPLPPPPVPPKVIVKEGLPQSPPRSSLQEDPTPTAKDLGKKTPPKEIIAPSEETIKKPPYHYDTLFQFASVELEGKLQKN